MGGGKMSSERDLRYERVSLYSASLVFGERVQPDILRAIAKTSKSNLGIGAISIVGPGSQDATSEGARRIKSALGRADTIVDSYSTGSPGLWIFNPDSPNIGRARTIAHNCNGLFTYDDDKHTREFTAAYKILSIIHAIDLAEMIDQGRFVTFHVGDVYGAHNQDIEQNLLIVAQYARSRGVYLGLERGEVPSQQMVNYVKKVNTRLGDHIVRINNDTANPEIWGGTREKTLDGSKILKESGEVAGEHAKGAKPITGAAASAWQADEAPIYGPDNVVNLVEEAKMSKELFAPDGKPLRLTVKNHRSENGGISCLGCKAA